MDRRLVLMTAMRTTLVLSEAGRTSLATAGITVGWLSAWLKSAGTTQVAVQAFESDQWKDDGANWCVIIADEDELMRAALQQGQRIGVDRAQRRTVLGAQTLQLGNPDRMAWLYRHGSEGARTLLLPPGDMAYTREAWLHLLNDGRAFIPLHICLEGDDTAGMVLEPGLCAYLGERAPAGGGYALNDGGYLPEEQVKHLLHDHGLRLRLAESCTAGGLASRLARMPGASQVLDRAWVTYSNEAKQQELGVEAALIEAHGAVSREVVEEMVIAGIATDAACIAVSGIAGPDGGSAAKPVGTVWVAVRWPGDPVQSRRFLFAGSRAEIQARTEVFALAMLLGAARGDWPLDR
jgi:PncC family amidohydrolase